MIFIIIIFIKWFHSFSRSRKPKTDSAFVSISLLYSTKDDIYPVFGTTPKNGNKPFDPGNKRAIAPVYIYSCPSIGFFH